MSEQRHTAGKIKFIKLGDNSFHLISDDKKYDICQLEQLLDEHLEENEANAHRLADCWNALEAVEDPEVAKTHTEATLKQSREIFEKLTLNPVCECSDDFHCEACEIGDAIGNINHSLKLLFPTPTKKD